MLNFFLIRVRKNPEYAASEMVKAAARYKKQLRLVTIKATKFRRAEETRRKYTVPCKTNKSYNFIKVENSIKNESSKEMEKS